MNMRILGAALALGVLFSAGPIAQAQPAPGPAMRGQGASNYNIRREKQRLERIIDALNKDDRDYGGHKANAMKLLQQARVELQAAVDYEAAHPPQ